LKPGVFHLQQIQPISPRPSGKKTGIADARRISAYKDRTRSTA
jgi:hypothetical protein